MFTSKLQYVIPNYNRNNLGFKRVFYLCLFLSLVILIIFYLDLDSKEDLKVYYKYEEINYAYNFEAPNPKYLINTTNCKIPDLLPITEEVKQFIKPKSYKKCTNLPLLTFIEKSDGIALLKINKNALHQYARILNCCYSQISRIVDDPKENSVEYSSCISFVDEVKINVSSIRVICKDSEEKEVYKNIHAIALPSEEDKKLNQNIDDNNKFGVLLIGIDSISRLNFIRSMPKTYEYVDKYFINLKGYNKIGDNTLPNLGAILTGKTKPQIKDNCKYAERKLDECYIIWKDFKQHNYVTGYVEDQVTISTFNLDTLGFYNPPTDFYLRGYMLAAEQLPIQKYYGMAYCTGPENTGERVLNAAKDFSITHKIIPKFGLFWMNSFSHDNINLASSMDSKLIEFISDTKFNESIENTFLIFFSDHGFRFGDIRFTYTGWLEERMPFIYILVPDAFKERFPEEYNNFLINTERLTTPFDLYMTLQHIIQIGDPTYKMKTSIACPKCHSLFKIVKEDRTCNEASIDQHWCTCTGYTPISPKETIVIQLAHYVVNEINQMIKSSSHASICYEYNMFNIYSAGVSQNYEKDNKTVKYFLLVIETMPSAMFEATVEMPTIPFGDSHKLVGEISRLNKYSPHSYCTSDSNIKKYCYCKTVMDKVKNALCSILRC